MLLKNCCASSEKKCKQDTQSGNKVCPNDYEKKCTERGGSTLKRGNLGTGLETFSCYKSAPDVGKACSNDNECFYTCDLFSGINNNLCILQKTEENKDLVTEIYDCSTDKPGVCSTVPIDYNTNCGGPKFELNGKNLKIFRNWMVC